MLVLVYANKQIYIIYIIRTVVEEGGDVLSDAALPLGEDGRVLRLDWWEVKVGGGGEFGPGVAALDEEFRSLLRGEVGGGVEDEPGALGELGEERRGAVHDGRGRGGIGYGLDIGGDGVVGGFGHLMSLCYDYATIKL